MKHLLSSRWTFFYKVIFPAIWIGVFSLFTLSMWFDVFTGHEASTPGLVWMKWKFLLAVVLGTALLYWSCIRLKKVGIDEDGFHVSNYLRTITIPIHRLVRVSGSVMMSPELVWLEFDGPTKFGRKILFTPPLRITMGFTRHPLVGQLARLIANSKG